MILKTKRRKLHCPTVVGLCELTQRRPLLCASPQSGSRGPVHNSRPTRGPLCYTAARISLAAALEAEGAVVIGHHLVGGQVLGSRASVLLCPAAPRLLHVSVALARPGLCPLLLEMPLVRLRLA